MRIRLLAALALPITSLFTLACSGMLEGIPDAATDAATDEVEPAEPEPAVSPLMLDQVYKFDHAAAAKPEWDKDHTLTFASDGTCEHIVENTYKCSYTSTEAEGKWTVAITAYTSATKPDGSALDPIDLQPESFELGADGKSLTAASGMAFTAVEAAPEPEDGGEGEGDEGGGGAGGGGGGKAGKGGKGKGGKGGKNH